MACLERELSTAPHLWSDSGKDMVTWTPPMFITSVLTASCGIVMRFTMAQFDWKGRQRLRSGRDYCDSRQRSELRQFTVVLTVEAITPLLMKLDSPKASLPTPRFDSDTLNWQNPGEREEYEIELAKQKKGDPAHRLLS